jgi:hypothetical protein
VTSLLRTVTVPILRRKEIAGKQHAFIVQLNAERNVEAIAWHPDSTTNGAWDLLEAGDELTVTIREESTKFPGTFVGKAEPWDSQPNKLKTDIRKRKREEAELRRSDILLTPAYAEALQRARRLAGDPDTATWASRLVMAHLTPSLKEGSTG